MSRSPPDRAAIAAWGRTQGEHVLAGVQALYEPAHRRAALTQPVTLADAAYGPDPRNRLDLYAPAPGAAPAPVMLWVPGGGFVRGDKGSADDVFNAHAGRWAARNGMLGAVMNYRLAPVFTWPAGGEDVAAAVAWLRAHAAAFGGDPEQVLLAGTSAGAAHIASFLQLEPEPAGVAGAILISGIYGFARGPRDEVYWGPAALHRSRMPREAVTATNLPLLVTCSEFDPPRFQAELLGLLSARLERHGHMPRAQILSGHNYYSAANHLGTADDRLAAEMLGFMRDDCLRGAPRRDVAEGALDGVVA